MTLRCIWQEERVSRREAAFFPRVAPFRGKDCSVSFKVPYIWCLLAAERADPAALCRASSAAAARSQAKGGSVLHRSAITRTMRDGEGIPYQIPFKDGTMITHHSSEPLLLSPAQHNTAQHTQSFTQYRPRRPQAPQFGCSITQSAPPPPPGSPSAKACMLVGQIEREKSRVCTCPKTGRTRVPVVVRAACQSAASGEVEVR